MSTNPIDDHPGADVVQLPVSPQPAEAAPEHTPADVPELAPEPIVAEPGARRPIIPEAWQRDQIRGTVKQHAGLLRHRVQWHGIRIPWYVPLFTWYAIRGASRLVSRVLDWWHWPEGTFLVQQAVAKGNAGHGDAIQAHTTQEKTHSRHTRLLLVYIALGLAVGVFLILVLPVWMWPFVLTGLTVTLIWYGRPHDKPLVGTAIVPARYVEPTRPVIRKALGSLRIPEINALIRDGEDLTWITDVHRDGPGWGVQLDLPHGVTWKMIVAKRSELASGLRRPLSATWPEGMPGEHEGRLNLWIGYQDMAKMKQPAWPLLKSGTADIFAGGPFGTDPRGRPVNVGLFEVNWLIGAAPGQGKTGAVRVLASFVALDPLAEMWVHEHAGKGDLEQLAQVSHRYVSGLDDEAIEYASESLRMLRRELDRRSTVFKKIPRHMKPDGKVTRDMAARRADHLYPIVAFFDEIQNVFMHPEYGKQAQEDAAYVIRVGRAYGLILVLSTQRPAADAVPTAVSGIVTNRFCLKVPDQPANDLVLGTSSYKAGYDSTVFRPKTDAGLGWLKAEGDPRIVKTYYLDLNDTEKVAKRARGLREAAGTLTGYALGEGGDEVPDRVFAADVLSIFGADDNLWSETIAARLRETLPEAYDGTLTRDAVGSQLRAAGVPVKDVRETGKQQRKGCGRAAVAAVAAELGQP